MPKYCALPGCKECTGFKFPVDALLRQQWCVAIKRETPDRKLWQPNEYSVVCANHFKAEDFRVPVQSLAGLGGRTRRTLKDRAVPSLFSFKKRRENENRREEERRQRLERRRKISQDQTVLDVPVSPPPDVLHEVADEQAQEIMAMVGVDENGNEVRRDCQALQKVCQSTQTDDTEVLIASCAAKISANRLKLNPEMMQYYTGFEDFEHFTYVFKALRAASSHL